MPILKIEAPRWSSPKFQERTIKHDTVNRDPPLNPFQSRRTTGHRPLLHDDDGSLEDVGKSSTRNTHEDHDMWLRSCCDKQVMLYGQLEHAEEKMGIWELDLLHDEHECYNAFLFSTLRPSSIQEQNSPARVFGYGTVELRVRYDKASTTWKPMTLHNVRYVQAAPRENNHRVGLGALPELTNLHLPEPTALGDQGDGFLSIDNEVGCALGRINQGGRKIWTLRTHEDNDISQHILGITKKGFFGRWFMSSGSPNRSAKRQREDDTTEVR